MASAPMDSFENSPERPDWGRDDAAPSPRPAYRPPIGVPLQRPSRWAGPASLVLHALLLLAILAPLLGRKVFPTIIQGAGGPGPAGGGGGGRNGTGGSEHVVERLRYIQTAPAPPPAPVPNPLTPPVPKPPVEQKKPEPPKEQPKDEAKLDAPAAITDVAPTPGAGGGTGNDGTNGSGPGTGGGVGSGVGTGRGSGNGPGTGGGPGEIYPPSPDFVPMPPFPVPSKVRGDSIQLRFMVDERGNVMRLEFDPTRDGGYNKRIREQFSLVRFRPATKDGNPVASPAIVTLYFH